MTKPRRALRPLRVWLRMFIAWLAVPKLFWAAAGVIGLALLLSFGVWRTEPGVRVVGLVLEMLGIAVAATGIAQTRREFEKPNFLAQTKAWLLNFPTFKQTFISATGGGGLFNLSAEGRGELWKVGGDSVESRLLALEENLNTVRALASQIDARTHQESLEFKQALKIETSERTEGLAEVRRKLEAANTGGLALAIAGVWFLAVGLVLSTIPQELVDLANRLGGGA
jgi:hypothetical protein